MLVVQDKRCTWAFPVNSDGRMVTKALSWLTSLAYILNNSKSIIKKTHAALQNMNGLNHWRHHRSINWLSGHKGVKGSERADWLANSAIMEEVQEMEWADLISAIREAVHTKDFTDNYELVLSRMKALWVKLGVQPTKSGCHQQLYP